LAQHPSESLQRAGRDEGDCAGERIGRVFEIERFGVARRLCVFDLSEWILHKDVFSREELLAFEEDWRGNLRAGIGERGTDTIYLRAFSALCLSALAEREAKAPF